MAALWTIGSGLALSGEPLPSEPLQILGRVTDGAGVPITAAHVTLRRMPSNFEWSEGILYGTPPEDVRTSAVSDVEGWYVVTAPQPGVWEVLVEASGRVPMRLRPLPLVEPVVLPPVSLADDVGAQIEVRGLPASAAGSAAGAWVYAASADRKTWAAEEEEGWRPAARLGWITPGRPLVLPRAPDERLRVTVLPAGRETGVSEVGEARIQLTLQPEPICSRWVEVWTRGSEEAEARPVPEALVAVGRLAWPAGFTDENGRIELYGPRREEIQVFALAADGRRISGRLQIPRDCPPSGEPKPVKRFELADASGFWGRVVDATGGGPVTGALVWPGHDPGTFASTDEDGSFRLPKPSFERFWIQAEAAGRAPQARWVTEDRLAVTVAAADVGDLALHEAVTLDGRVVDTREAPVAGAHLAIRPDPATGDPPPFLAGRAASRAVSDAQGKFRLPGLQAGETYRLAATRAGYRAAEKAIPELAAREPEAPEVLVRLVEAAQLRGRVVTAEGQGIPEAELWLTEADAGRNPRMQRRAPDAKTDTDGGFVLGDLWPDEAVDLVADADGYLPREVEGLRPPLDKPLEVRLDRASGVEGRVVWKATGDEDGEGVGVEATVRLEPAGPPPGVAGIPRPPGARELTVQSDAEGHFRFAEVAPGAVVLEARARGFMPSAPVETEIPAADGLEGLVLELRRGAVLEGWVTDRHGEPVHKAQVRVGRISATSGGDGHYRAEGVEPGTQTVEVEHREFNRLTREVEIDPEWTAADFQLEGGWPVAGQVLDEEGRGIQDARVEIVRWAAREHRQYRETTGEDGRFRLDRVAEGTYSLSAARQGFAATSEPRAFEVEGRGVEDLQIVLAPGATVEGGLLGLAPEDLPRVHVTAESSEGLEQTGRVDPVGRYEVTDLGPGEWRVRGSLSGGRREATVAFAIERGQRRIERDLQFGGGLRLSGTVLLGGLPLAGARVAVTGFENASRRGVISDAEGRFELADLAAGAYRLSVVHQRELVVHNEDLTLAEDRDVVVEIRTAAISGRVSASTGEPIGDAMVLARQSVGEREGSLFTVATAPDGSFRLARLTAGTFDLEIRKSGFAPWESSLRLEPGDVVEGLEAVLDRTEGLVIAVQLATGETPPQATVSAFDPQGQLVHSEILGLTREGHGLVGALPAGTWQLLVGAPGAAPAWVEAQVPGDPVLVTLPLGGRLRIRVPALLEAGLSGSLTLADGAGRPWMAPDGAGVLRTTWPVEGGVAVVDAIPEGVWTLTVTGPRGEVWQAQAAVPAGGTAVVRVE